MQEERCMIIRVEEATKGDLLDEQYWGRVTGGAVLEEGFRRSNPQGIMQEKLWSGGVMQ